MKGVSIVRTRSRRDVIRETIQSLGVSCRCPHGNPLSSQHRHASNTDPTDYAYEMSSCSVRVGRGVTREVGKDFVNRGVKRILLFTDNNLMQHIPFSAALDSLTSEKLEFDVFSEVRVEPTEKSLKEAIHKAQQGEYGGFLAVGGGSVMDTAKVARLFESYPDRDFFDFVNKPIGKGEPILRPLKPLICIPTTSGTGSEMTGVAIFLMNSMNTKTAFFNRALCPTLALVDPQNALSMPKNVAIYTGLDVLCSALESYTAIPYSQRKPLPPNPMLRPPNQGSNPLSDIWAVEAIKLVEKYLFRAVDSIEDIEACSQMSFASMLGGIGFSNAGVHLCHAISYGISGLPKEFYPAGYPADHPFVPHGLSVVMTAPAVFSEIGHVYPDRCKQLATLMGANTTNVKTEDVGRCMSDQLCRYMKHVGIPNGLSALGYTTEDIPSLVKTTSLHKRQTDLSPTSVTSSFLESILLNSMTIYN